MQEATRSLHCLFFASNVLSQHRNRNSLEIKIFGSLLNFTNGAKYFGILIDNQLSWKNQILVVPKKLSVAVGVL